MAFQNDKFGQISMNSDENSRFPNPTDHHNFRVLFENGLTSSDYDLYLSLAWQALATKASRTHDSDEVPVWNGLDLNTAELQGRRMTSWPTMVTSLSSSTTTRPRRHRAGFYIDDILGNKSKEQNIIADSKTEDRCLRGINRCVALYESWNPDDGSTSRVRRDQSDTMKFHRRRSELPTGEHTNLGVEPSLSQSSCGEDDVSRLTSTDGDETAGRHVIADAADDTTEKRTLSERNTDFELPTWIYCTRYSDRPSAGPRCRRKSKDDPLTLRRQRTSFTKYQLSSLQDAFQNSPYLTDHTRLQLAAELQLDVSKIKVWFQNRRASVKKTRATRNGLALRLMADGLYDHSTRHTDE